MVKAGNKRVMITCTEKMLDNIDYLCRLYDLNITQLIKLLVSKEAAERKRD